MGLGLGHPLEPALGPEPEPAMGQELAQRMVGVLAVTMALRMGQTKATKSAPG